jgi:hypothetical protein
MLDYFRDQDVYGAPITLNYQGSDTYKTLPGGLISFSFGLIFSSYCLVQFVAMMDLENWSIT